MLQSLLNLRMENSSDEVEQLFSVIKLSFTRISDKQSTVERCTMRRMNVSALSRSQNSQSRCVVGV